jgi:hypothetical protein
MCIFSFFNGSDNNIYCNSVLGSSYYYFVNVSHSHVAPTSIFHPSVSVWIHYGSIDSLFSYGWCFPFFREFCFNFAAFSGIYRNT